MTYPLQARARTYAAEMPEYFEPQFYQQSALTAYVESILEAYESAETAILALREQFAPATAIGAFLDLLGEDVGEQRGGRADADYRIAVSARIAVRRSRGTWDDVVTALRLLSGDAAADVTIADVGGSKGAEAYAEVHVDVSALDTAFINAAIQRAKPIGVRLHYVYWPDAESDLFTLASGLTVETGADLGLADVGMTVGGRLVGAYDR